VVLAEERTLSMRKMKYLLKILPIEHRCDAYRVLLSSLEEYMLDGDKKEFKFV